MGRRPCCTKEGTKRGAWTATEDEMLVSCIRQHGEGKWGTLPSRAGLRRCGKSCRLRWLNYLRPGIKRGNISADEDDLILRLHRLLGNRWSLIAGRLPGRTDNEIKNYWNTTLSKRLHSNTADHQCRAQLKTIGGAAPRAARRRSPEPTTSPIRTKAVRWCTTVLAATAAASAGHQPESAPGVGGGHAEESVEQSAGAGEQQEDWCVPVEEMDFDLDDIELGFLSPWRGDLLAGGGEVGAADLEVEEALIGAMGDGDYHLELAPWLL